MDIDELEDALELNDPKARREIEKSTEDFRAVRSRPARELLAELLEEKESKARHTQLQKI